MRLDTRVVFWGASIMADLWILPIEGIFIKMARAGAKSTLSAKK
jgi:hypothetical protein